MKHFISSLFILYVLINFTHAGFDVARFSYGVNPVKATDTETGALLLDIPEDLVDHIVKLLETVIELIVARNVTLQYIIRVP